ncbi:DUF4040 domain-containing protein [Verticiella sediminum]|uniref:DUF4040 domain-containing protein n=1 Tax=Verticiella sediminum TaxID=1247510 RepID=A0A556AKN4_9BURK|nr:hydrogen gas-evolving membrane-bound hydrogenase subunit E [Verticiella sediminum]TSH93446.1 DUF4040 domain-containing protein [Verticiella sediminum]
MSAALLVALAFCAAPATYACARARLPAFAALAPAALFAGFALLLPQVAAQGALLETHPWIPTLGIALGFRVDGWSLLFALLITGIGTGIFLYASRYLAGERDLPRFYAVLTLFMGAMLGAVLADDLIALLVFWELTSLTSFLLIGYDPTGAPARRSAQQGLLVTVAGGLAMLAGAILLGSAAGTYSVSELLARREAIAALPEAPAIIVLIAIGAFAKSAQAPLHAWLPNAMVAPTPVSAFLHSATMVKLGVYLLGRLDPVFGENTLWVVLLSVAGMATMLVGTLLALRQTDLKRVLAYSTVVSLGTLVLLIGMQHPLAAVATVVFLLVHALYKACLFMVAGIIDHATGTRDATQISGLGRLMPVTCVAALAAALSMSGLPPFVGFLGKELMYEAGLGGSSYAWLMLAVALLANACMVVVAGVVAVRCFFGAPRDWRDAPHGQPHDPAPAMLAGPLVLAALGLYFGLAPGHTAALLAPSASALRAAPVELSLTLWHGFTPMLALSALTLALGVYGLWRWHPLREAMARNRLVDACSTDLAYDRALDGMMRFAAWQTRAIQSGSLRRYTGFSLGFSALAILVTLFSTGGFAWPSWGEVLQPAAVLPPLLMLAAYAVLRADSFIKGIVAAGMVGFGLAIVFLFNGAPDLAFTQFAVEALSIVILLAIIGHMPFRQRDKRTPAQKRRDAIIAAGLGTAFALVLTTIVAAPFDGRLSDFFREASVPLAHGRNLVNVIIVDFRALDTLGEITVLALAALSAAAIVASAPLRRRKPAAKAAAAQAPAPGGTP